MNDAVDIGLPLNKIEFRRLVESYLEKMRSKSQFNSDDYIMMARLWNTIIFKKLAAADQLYKTFAATLYPAYGEEIRQGLNATITKGMALYSKAFDIYIGGIPHSNSQFKLED